MSYPSQISFYQRFETDILAGKKTITIRDESERHFAPGSEVDVVTFEQNRLFCRIEITSVDPISFDELNEVHARQENMSLSELKSVIAEIYPGIYSLYKITFKLCTPKR